ncbi:MAG: ferritin family protein [Methanomassiliicoccales archaeon]|jgi:rubrerythrin|nr:ferritin family protein [Methanomassiliicoccales archaeon]MDD1755901.1 ferritin family protein [Methanomassiliicoccales archaeon]
MEDAIARKEMSAAVLKTALAIEEFGIRFYSELSDCVADERGRALMRSLGSDEQEHARIIKKEMERLSIRTNGSGVEPLHEYLEILPEKVFTRPKDSCLTVEDEIAALQKGIEVEINSIRMYQDASSRALDPKTMSTIEELTRWELRHREILEENMRTLKLGGAWYGYGPILEG